MEAAPARWTLVDDTRRRRQRTVPEENLDIIGVERTATQQEIKKAYYKLALLLHPDKNPGDEEVKEKFQLLQKVISILGDEEKRAFYDQTGCVEDAVTEADIEEFEANYRGSDTEKKDLKDLYKEFKGNMNRSNKGAMTDLIAAISHRSSERREQSESVFSSMITKYGKGEPSDGPSVKERKRGEGRNKAKRPKQK
ncbi:Chaperone protein dnaJ 6 [Asimina triloba]